MAATTSPAETRLEALRKAVQAQVAYRAAIAELLHATVGPAGTQFELELVDCWATLVAEEFRENPARGPVTAEDLAPLEAQLDC